MDGRDAARAFLDGDPSILAHVRGLIEQVVKAFHPPGGDMPGELVQEIMSRLCASLRAGRFRGVASLDTYAQSVARYTCVEVLRRRRRESHLEVEKLPSAACWSSPEEWLIRREEYQNHLRAFSSLAPECQELLRLVFAEGRSYREVADRLGITEGALKSRIHRCRLALRAAAGAPQGAGRGQADLAPTNVGPGERV